MEYQLRLTGPYSPASSRSSSTSSGPGGPYGGQMGVMFGSTDLVMEDDVFGLKGLMSSFYAPELESELERLFFGPACCGGRGSPDSLGSPMSGHKSVWDDFNMNGHDAQLDDLDRLFRGLNSTVPSSYSENFSSNNSAGQSDSSQPPSPPPPPHIIVDQLNTMGGGACSPMERSSVTNHAVQEILTKAHLIDILREREQLQRSQRNVKRVIVSGGGVSGVMGGTKASKSATGKVCVFCRNNGEAEAVYSSHQLKDPEGNVTCPILYIYTCPICGANGKQSHTIKYCPYNTGDVLSMKSLTKTARTAVGKRVMPLM